MTSLIKNKTVNKRLTDMKIGEGNITLFFDNGTKMYISTGNIDKPLKIMLTYQVIKSISYGEGGVPDGKLDGLCAK